MAPRPYFNQAKEVVSFYESMRLEKIDETTYRSVTKAYSPTGGENGTYGGHVYSQAAWAAAQTVEEGFVIHSITGYFVLGGIPSEHYVYSVQIVRDGGNYCTRMVTATQIAEKGATFTCTCSFKRAEFSSVDYQSNLDLHGKYKAVLAGKQPFDHPDAPSLDSDWFRETYIPAHPEHFNPLAGMHIRSVDMSSFNTRLAPHRRRKLILYSLRGSLPSPATPAADATPTKSRTPKYKGLSFTRAANLHALTHIYASDRNSLYVIPNHLDLSRKYTRMASLSHTVIFHSSPETFFMPNEPRTHAPNAAQTQQNTIEGDEGLSTGERKWFMQESWMERASGGRCLHVSRHYDPDTGCHLATTMQDGLVRFSTDAEVKL
ncbi:acyl-CoA thioesteras-like protein [Eremomyces bilateralis CBS 781.70]|uniref:Acyl-CoA thioesteras-like protein n=1 Tax=Eremomyces bilateralis CBS 781.70 TaxID=1392243 RepID=A0A6G1G3M9_9PEZI|nr:acyl-CoA thioesteras-like protein [Eremomyces bilateralis CBS 781.70]KAF1812618.1 acyl-CoA thioesteras-like protein [Eremomyces bilateralis CBS 781.70]